MRKLPRRHGEIRRGGGRMNYYCCFLRMLVCFMVIYCHRNFSPHLCVGFLFLILYPGSASSLLPPVITHHLSNTSLSTTIFHTPSLSTTIGHHLSPHLCQLPSFTHIFVNHLSHTIFVSHQLSPSFTIFVNHLCQQPSLSTTIFHHLCHTLSFTHSFHTILSTTIFHTPSFTHTHTTFTHNFVNHLCQPPSFPCHTQQSSTHPL